MSMLADVISTIKDLSKLNKYDKANLLIALDSDLEWGWIDDLCDEENITEIEAALKFLGYSKESGE